MVINKYQNAGFFKAFCNEAQVSKSLANETLKYLG